MENDEIVFTTQNYDCNGILRRILLALTFGTLAVASTILVQESYLYFCLVGFLLFLMFCMFCSAWKLSYKIRSYITLTDNVVKGRSFPARDCTSGWYFFELKYSDIHHMDLDKDFIILYSTFGKYKVYTKDSGVTVKYYIEQYGTEYGNKLFEQCKILQKNKNKK